MHITGDAYCCQVCQAVHVARAREAQPVSSTHMRNIVQDVKHIHIHIHKSLNRSISCTGVVWLGTVMPCDCPLGQQYSMYIDTYQHNAKHKELKTKTVTSTTGIELPSEKLTLYWLCKTLLLLLAWL